MSTEATGGEIYRLIPKIMAEVGAIGKGRKNAQQGYAFRGIDDVYNALQGPLAANGVFIVPDVIEQVREERQTQKGGLLLYTILRVKHTFYAPDGSSVQAVTVGEAMDSGDKSANKAMSAAMKYACLEVFAIPTEDDNDTENHSHDVAPRNQPQPRRNDPPPRQAKPTPQQVSVAEVKAKLKVLADAVHGVTLPEGWDAKWFSWAKVDRYEAMTPYQLDKVIEAARKIGGETNKAA